MMTTATTTIKINNSMNTMTPQTTANGKTSHYCTFIEFDIIYIMRSGNLTRQSSVSKNILTMLLIFNVLQDIFQSMYE